MTAPDPRSAEQTESVLAAQASKSPSTSAGTENPRESAGCPSPVPWRDVVRAFHAESRAWKLDRGRYEVEGWTWGEGPPIYFLHGLSATSELFALFAWLLREQYRCVLINFPGSRRDAPVRGKLTLDDLVSDLFLAADRHGDGKFQIFASSFGCLVALEALRRRPAQVERAILQGGFAHLQLSGVERLLVRLGLFMPGPLNILAFRRTIQAYNHRRWFPPFDADRWQFFIERTGQVPIVSIAQRSAIIRDYDGRSALSEIRQPVLLIRSEGEGLVASICHEELAAGLPHAQIEWLHSCGHLPYLTHPHRLANVVRSFLCGEDAVSRSDAQPVSQASPEVPADSTAPRPSAGTDKQDELNR